MYQSLNMLLSLQINDYDAYKCEMSWEEAGAFCPEQTLQRLLKEQFKVRDRVADQEILRQSVEISPTGHRIQLNLYIHEDKLLAKRKKNKKDSLWKYSGLSEVVVVD